jgi:hypothetical protein
MWLEGLGQLKNPMTSSGIVDYYKYVSGRREVMKVNKITDYMKESRNKSRYQVLGLLYSDRKEAEIWEPHAWDQRSRKFGFGNCPDGLILSRKEEKKNEIIKYLEFEIILNFVWKRNLAFHHEM